MITPSPSSVENGPQTSPPVVSPSLSSSSSPFAASNQLTIRYAVGQYLLGLSVNVAEIVGMELVTTMLQAYLNQSTHSGDLQRSIRTASRNTVDSELHWAHWYDIESQKNKTPPRSQGSGGVATKTNNAVNQEVESKSAESSPSPQPHHPQTVHNNTLASVISDKQDISHNNNNNNNRSASVNDSPLDSAEYSEKSMSTAQLEEILLVNNSSRHSAGGAVSGEPDADKVVQKLSSSGEGANNARDFRFRYHSVNTAAHGATNPHSNVSESHALRVITTLAACLLVVTSLPVVVSTPLGAFVLHSVGLRVCELLFVVFATYGAVLHRNHNNVNFDTSSRSKSEQLASDSSHPNPANSTVRTPSGRHTFNVFDRRHRGSLSAALQLASTGRVDAQTAAAEAAAAANENLVSGLNGMVDPQPVLPSESEKAWRRVASRNASVIASETPETSEEQLVPPIVTPPGGERGEADGAQKETELA
eukprot:gene21454-27487_t